MVDVGPLLPVHLNAHKPVVQNAGRLLVLKRLPLHHVAPMAGGIPDGKENRLVFLPRLFERLLPPWMPVHRVISVLQQVGRFFMDQFIGRFI
ncbi:hypothetical protein SDC9_186964 [bioreactor metagenome]|uniref:Uncharacterized protein n=1 Tax=bioreactor metagenome TaxID=1076179 RepID=A0A645HLM5_9ZZZZ